MEVKEKQSSEEVWLQTALSEVTGILWRPLLHICILYVIIYIEIKLLPVNYMSTSMGLVIKLITLT